MEPRSFGTHDGSFHADEVMACALLVLFDKIDRNKIVRTRDPEKLSSCAYVCDVGGVYEPKTRRFDHHQSEYLGALSSAGMVWEYLLSQGVIDEATYHYVNHSLLIGIDAIDNGRDFPLIGHCSFSQVISNFVPPEYDVGVKVMERAFGEALDFTLGHLKRLLERFRYISSCREKILKKMETSKTVLIFDEPMPWMDNFFDLGGESHPALFVIMPSGAHWKLRGIPPSPRERMAVRVPLPENWAGLIDEELQRVSGISGAIFCHKGRFVSVWETKEDALLALSHILGKDI